MRLRVTLAGLATLAVLAALAGCSSSSSSPTPTGSSTATSTSSQTGAPSPAGTSATPDGPSVTTTSTAGLPAAVRKAINSVNNGDITGFLESFPSSGTIVYFGQSITGNDSIREWSDASFLGQMEKIAVTSTQLTKTGAIVKGRLSGNAHNGPATFTFTVTSKLVSTLVVTA